MSEVVVTAEQPNDYRVSETISAARTTLPLIDLPQSVQVVPSRVIEDQAIVRPAEALRNVSGVVRTPAYLGLTDSYIIRGFAADTGLWNGFRRDLYIGFNDISAIDRIEVLKGPSSGSYGILEPGGVVNYVTKRPTKEPYGKVDIKAGSFDYYRPSLDLSGPVTEDASLRYRLNSAYEHSGGFRDFQESDLFALSGALDWDISDKTKLQFEFSYSDFDGGADRGFPTSLGPVIFSLPTQRNLGEPSDSYALWQLDTALTLTHEFSDAVSLRSGFFFNRVEDDRRNTQGFELDADGRTLLRGYTDVPSWSENFSWFSDLTVKFKTGSVKHTALFGIDLQRNNYAYDFNSGEATDLNIFAPNYSHIAPNLQPDGNFESQTNTLGLYVQDHITFSDKWKLLAGVRWDAYDYEDVDRDYDSATQFSGNGFSPRAGLVYQPVEDVSLYGSYSQSLKPNTYARTRSGSIVDPEVGKQWELGVKTELFDGRLSPSLAFYHLTKENVAVPDPADPSGNFSIISGEQRSRGIEFDVTAELTPGWNLIASYAYTDAEVTADTSLPVGDALLNVPPHGASFSTTYEIQSGALKGAGITASIFFVDEREAELPNTYKIPSFVRFDAGVFYKRGNWRYSVDFKNIGYEEYYDSQGYSVYPGAPFSVLAGISYSW